MEKINNILFVTDFIAKNTPSKENTFYYYQACCVHLSITDAYMIIKKRDHAAHSIRKLWCEGYQLLVTFSHQITIPSLLQRVTENQKQIIISFLLTDNCEFDENLQIVTSRLPEKV